MNNVERVLSSLSHYPGTTLVAVSKTVGPAAIVEAYHQGLRCFGENKVQDALPKVESIDLPIEWHFIGRLQTNKVRKVAGKFALIHSLDSLRLAEELDRVGRSLGCEFRCLVQVNASGEITKQGLPVNEVRTFLENVAKLNNVTVHGLMTMAPAEDVEIIRTTFRTVRQLYEDIASASIPRVSMEHLSMGMSGDYEIALAEGSNMVRIGSALFGNKNS